MTTQLTSSTAEASRATGIIAAIAAALLAGACSADLGSIGGLAQLSGSGKSEPETAGLAPKSELDKAIEHWGSEHAKSPNDLKAALAYARNLKAAGKKEEAFAVLQQVALVHGQNKELASEYGRLALDLGQVQVAQGVLAMADDPAKPDWRVISARGTVLAKQGQYADAIPYYERALTLAPKQTSVVNNLAMAHAANGEPAKAEEMLRSIPPDKRDTKVQQNLALVLGLQSKHEEARQVAATSMPEATAAANTEFVRNMVKATPAPDQQAPQVQPASTSAPARSAPATSAAAATAKPQTTVTAQKGKDQKKPGLRGSGDASDVAASPGRWSTSVARAQ